MEKIRLVVDTSVCISAIISRSEAGAPKRIFEKVRKGEMLVILSPQIVEEILSKSEDPKLKLSEEVIINFLKSISNNIIQINGDVKCDRLNKVDPSDNIILAAGLEGKVDYIVTADKGILNIKNYHTIQIVNPTQFLKECKDYQKFKHRSLQKV